MNKISANRKSTLKQQLPREILVSPRLYYAEKLYLNGELVTNLVIPEGVTSIGKYAFFCFTGLTSITFEDTSTWYRASSSNYTGGTQTDVTNPAENATYFTSTYDDYYWHKK